MTYSRIAAPSFAKFSQPLTAIGREGFLLVRFNFGYYTRLVQSRYNHEFEDRIVLRSRICCFPLSD